ncbi:MAG: hypothetical protein A2289_00320 [Deltaproteobacteria bacterium RIFOXYA12_FULL_58_15]|nr:MAG: hypothetical protein A2289_00320 [Deltaproteobacteria bacterium RIFOXYA12_FULL_58_15]
MLEVFMESAQPTSETVQIANEALSQLRPLRKIGQKVEVRLEVPSRNASVVVPGEVYSLVVRILTELSVGNGVTILPVNAELTTQQAADLLSVSRPYFVSLLESGKIPHRKVGVRRRVLAEDVVVFKRKDDAARRKVLDELAAEAQELGLGY